MLGPNYETLVITERRASLNRSLRGADAFLKLLHVLVILGHERRRLIRLGVTAHPSAEWFARQVTKAFPRDEAPWHLNRDRDRAFGIYAAHSCDWNPRSSDRRSVTLSFLICGEKLRAADLCHRCAMPAARRLSAQYIPPLRTGDAA
jgi:hypothetical protein